VFNDWLPFAIYGLFALMVPATMMVGSFVFATRPHRRVRERTIPFESGVSQGPPQRQRFTVSFYLRASSTSSASAQARRRRTAR